MMRAMVLVLNLVFFCFCSSAQPIVDDSVFLRNAKTNTIAFYHNEMGERAGIFNGKQYTGYPFVFDQGHPFFYSNKPEAGSVVYGNILYQNIYLNFDEISGQVVLQQSNRSIQLLEENITAFSILQRHFVRLVKDSAHVLVPGTGFYELLYTGSTTVLKKEVKTIVEDIKSGTLSRGIETDAYFYMEKNGQYYSIKSQRDVLKVYKDYKRQMQQFVKENNLNFRREPDKMLVAVADFSETLQGKK